MDKINYADTERVNTTFQRRYTEIVEKNMTSDGAEAQKTETKNNTSRKRKEVHFGS